MEKNKKTVKVTGFLIIVACITSFYFYFTRPVNIVSLVNRKTIKDISISTDISQRALGQLPANLKHANFKLNSDQDFEAFINILNKYKYSRTLDFLDGWFFPYPANSTNGTIDIFINHLNDDNKAAQMYVFVDAEDDADISLLNLHVTYRIRGKSSELFKDLSNWLSEKQ